MRENQKEASSNDEPKASAQASLSLFPKAQREATTTAMEANGRLAMGEAQGISAQPATVQAAPAPNPPPARTPITQPAVPKTGNLVQQNQVRDTKALFAAVDKLVGKELKRRRYSRAYIKTTRTTVNIPDDCRAELDDYLRKHEVVQSVAIKRALRLLFAYEQNRIYVRPQK